MRTFLIAAGMALVSCLVQGEPLAEADLPEQKIIYHPHKILSFEAKDTGLPLEDLYFRTSDGVRLNAWWMAPARGRATILYFHGNGGNLCSTAHTLSIFHRQGLGAFVVDYRGYGRSQGRPYEGGVYEDGRAAYRECLRRVGSSQRVVIHGQSLGGAVAAQLATEKPCAGLILESTFSNADEMARQMLGKKASLFVRSRFPTVKNVSKIKVPLLVIHGDQDDYIPSWMGLKIFQSAPQPKTWWLVPGANHNNLRFCAGEEFPRRVATFARQVTPEIAH